MIENLHKYKKEINELTTEINSIQPLKVIDEKKVVEPTIKISSRVYIFISIAIIIVSIILLIYNRPFFVLKQTDIEGTKAIKNYELDYTKLSVVTLLEMMLLFYIFNVL